MKASLVCNPRIGLQRGWQGGGGGGGATSAVYKRNTISGAADITGAGSGSYSEISSSMRVTVTVPASGNVIARCSLVMQSSAATEDARLAVGVDGVAGAVQMGGVVLDNLGGSVNTLGVGEVELTGISPGIHTFYFCWLNNNGSAGHYSIIATHQVINNTCWLSITTVP